MYSFLKLNFWRREAFIVFQLENASKLLNILASIYHCFQNYGNIIDLMFLFGYPYNT